MAERKTVTINVSAGRDVTIAPVVGERTVGVFIDGKLESSIDKDTVVEFVGTGGGKLTVASGIPFVPRIANNTGSDMAVEGPFVAASGKKAFLVEATQVNLTRMNFTAARDSDSPTKTKYTISTPTDSIKVDGQGVRNFTYNITTASGTPRAATVGVDDTNGGIIRFVNPRQNNQVLFTLNGADTLDKSKSDFIVTRAQAETAVVKLLNNEMKDNTLVDDYLRFKKSVADAAATPTSAARKKQAIDALEEGFVKTHGMQTAARESLGLALTAMPGHAQNSGLGQMGGVVTETATGKPLPPRKIADTATLRNTTSVAWQEFEASKKAWPQFFTNNAPALPTVTAMADAQKTLEKMIGRNGKPVQDQVDIFHEHLDKAIAEATKNMEERKKANQNYAGPKNILERLTTMKEQMNHTAGFEDPKTRKDQLETMLDAAAVEAAFAHAKPAQGHADTATLGRAVGKVMAGIADLKTKHKAFLEKSEHKNIAYELEAANQAVRKILNAKNEPDATKVEITHIRIDKTIKLLQAELAEARTPADERSAREMINSLRAQKEELNKVYGLQDAQTRNPRPMPSTVGTPEVTPTVPAPTTPAVPVPVVPKDPPAAGQVADAETLARVSEDIAADFDVLRQRMPVYFMAMEEKPGHQQVSDAMDEAQSSATAMARNGKLNPVQVKAFHERLDRAIGEATTAMKALPATDKIHIKTQEQMIKRLKLIKDKANAVRGLQDEKTRTMGALMPPHRDEALTMIVPEAAAPVGDLNANRLAIAQVGEMLMSMNMSSNAPGVGRVTTPAEPARTPEDSPTLAA